MLIILRVTGFKYECNNTFLIDNVIDNDNTNWCDLKLTHDKTKIHTMCKYPVGPQPACGKVVTRGVTQVIRKFEPNTRFTCR